MTHLILFGAIVLILCVLVYKFFNKFGVPMLIIFIALGMIFGESGIFKIQFDDYQLAYNICSIALIYIIFYGGFGTKLSMAKGIKTKAVVLSSLGVMLTAILTSVFTRYVLKLDWQLSLLIGAVLSSTDAASVFSILRSNKLNLKENTASLLEIESGSNDPMANVLTISFLSFAGVKSLSILLFKQIFIGIAIGVLVSHITKYLLKKLKNIDSSYIMTFITGIMLLSYALSDFLGGNGYISVYLFGVIIGNIKFSKKEEIVTFFNGITNIMQISIFFMLGLLVSPLTAIQYMRYSILIMVALTLVIRPIVVFLLLKPTNSSFGQKMLVSFAGLRGVASVVFSLFVINSNKELGLILFNICFIIVFLSISIQGFLLPYCSKKLDMIDEKENVMRTFNDYSEQEDVDFIISKIQKGHEWVGKKISEINLMPGILLVLIIRNNEKIIPDGNTIIEYNDNIVICGSSYVQNKVNLNIYEYEVQKDCEYIGKEIKDLKKNILVIMIKRDNDTIIPKGDTMILENDQMVILDR